MAEVVKAESLDPEVHTRETGYQRLRFQMMEYVHFLHYFARIQGENMPVQVYERYLTHLVDLQQCTGMCVCCAKPRITAVLLSFCQRSPGWHLLLALSDVRATGSSSQFTCIVSAQGPRSFQLSRM